MRDRQTDIQTKTNLQLVSLHNIIYMYMYSTSTSKQEYGIHMPLFDSYTVHCKIYLTLYTGTWLDCKRTCFSMYSCVPPPPFPSSAVYVFAITVLKALVEAIAEPIADAIAQIIATIFVVIFGGLVAAIFSALTGRPIRMPTVPTIGSTRRRSVPRKTSTAAVPSELRH